MRMATIENTASLKSSRNTSVLPVLHDHGADARMAVRNR
jgi:hypothetical protein